MPDRESIYVKSTNNVSIIPDEFINDVKNVIMDEGLDCEEVYCMLENNIIGVSNKSYYIPISYYDEDGVYINDVNIFGWKAC